MSSLPPIPTIWKNRFHRSDRKNEERGTKRWRFYISRPTLELLRRTDEESQEAFNLARSAIKYFLETTVTSQKYDGHFKVTTRKNAGKQQYCSLTYPFSLMDEEIDCYGVVLHIGKQWDAGVEWTSKKIDDEKIFENEKKKWPTMFEEIKGLNLPPLVENADPRWKEFRMSKLLPTDYLKENWGVFRRLISHQFIEIRLVNTPNSRSEQIEALNKFHGSESGFCNFAGAPGTGKSTLLHMICANRLMENKQLMKEGKEPNNILYYVPSRGLKSEAKREIRAILKHVYGVEQPEEISSLMKHIVIKTQEEMFLQVRPNNRWNLASQDSDDELKKIFGKNYPEEDIKRIKQTVRSVIFGVFGSLNLFLEWKNAHKSNLEREWKTVPLSLADPERKKSTKHAITLNDFADWHEKKIDKFLNIELPKLKFFNKNDINRFWDPTGMIEFSHKIHSSHPQSVWKQLAGKIDCLVIDEVQDINISEIKILLNHFSNRQSDRHYKEFKFVSAGDENQTVMGLVFRPRNDHIKALFEDWIMELRYRPLNKDKLQLSQNLNTLQDDLLEQSYRIFNENIGYARHILTELSDPDNSKSHQATMSKTEFGRKGIFLTLPDDINKSRTIKTENKERIGRWTKSILDQFERQFDTDETVTPPVRVALTFDKNDYKYKTDDDVNTNPIEELLYHEHIDEEIAKSISSILGRFGTWFIEQEKLKENNAASLDQELKRAFALRGVMTVEEIKGLTVPVTIVVPPVNFIQRQGKKKIGTTDKAKLLVQITRAQYVNLLLRDDNYFHKVIDEDKRNINSKIIFSEIDGTLTDILQYTMGMDLEFNRLLNQTLTDYESLVLWERLNYLSSTLEDETKLYVKWLSEFHKHLIANKAFDRWNEMYNNKKKVFTVAGKVIKLRRIQDADEYYSDGMRVSEHMMNSLYMFVAMNYALRANTDLPPVRLSEMMEAWSEGLNREDVLSPAQSETKDWFSLLLDPQIAMRDIADESSKHTNQITKALNECFNINITDSKFPLARELPSIDLGSWGLKMTTKMKSDKDNPPSAWLETRDSPYKIPAQFLISGLDHNLQRGEDLGEYVSKIKLYISLIARDEDLFVEELSYTIRRWITTDKKEYSYFLPWFITLFNIKNDEVEKGFKDKVRDKLEHELEADQTLKEAIGRFINESSTIDEMELRVGALQFTNWDQSVERFTILETSIALTSEKIRNYNQLQVLIKPPMTMLTEFFNKDDLAMTNISAKIDELMFKIRTAKMDIGIEEEKMVGADAVTTNVASKQITMIQETIAEYNDEIADLEDKKVSRKWDERRFRKICQPFIQSIEEWNRQYLQEPILFESNDMFIEDPKVKLERIEECFEELAQKKKSMENPYFPGPGKLSLTHNFFNSLLKSDKSQMMRLRALYSTQLALSSINFSHIRGVEFPQPHDSVTNNEIRKGIHLVANFWTPNFNTEMKKGMFKQLREDLHPAESSSSKGWLSFLSSIEKAYIGINSEEKASNSLRRIRDELSFDKINTNGIKAHRDLYHLFLQPLFTNESKVFLPFIECCLGLYKPDKKNVELSILSRSEFKAYIGGDAGKLIDFIFHKGKDGKRLLREPRQYEGFVENIELDFTQRQLQSSLFDPIPLGNMKGPIFNTALIFAFKEIAEEKYMAASITLSKAGMLNYAAAAQLTSIFREGEDLRKEILTSLKIILEREYNHIKAVMHKGRFDTDKDDYAYGINLAIRKNILKKGDKLKLEGKKSTDDFLLSYLDRYDLAKAGLHLAEQIGEVIETTKNSNDYLGALNEKLSHDHDLYVRKKKEGDEFWTLKWLENIGYQYVKNDKKLLNFKSQERFSQILEFIEYVCIQKNDSKEEFHERVTLLTGIEGTLARVFADKKGKKAQDIIVGGSVNIEISTKEREANEIREILGSNIETEHLVVYVKIWMDDPKTGQTTISREPALLGGQKNRILEILINWIKDKEGSIL